ncbi:BatD family protein [Flavitalea flava]
MNPIKSIKFPAIVTFLRIPFLILIILVPGFFAAGQVKFTTVTSSQEIGRGEYLQVEFVVENAKQIEQLNPPDFPGFQVAQGPIQSSGMSIVNGNMSQYKALSFVLQPVKTGKFTIQGASAVVDGKRMTSNTVTVIVTAGTSGSGNSSNNSNPNNNSRSNPFLQPAWPDPRTADPNDVEKEYILRPGENAKEKIRKNLFVRVQVDKNTCFVGEPIVATYKLYSRLSSESRVTKRPSLNGFSVYDMVDPNSEAVSVEKMNGKAFVVHIIRKTQLIPLQAGTIDLDPVEVENTVHFVKREEGSRGEGRSSGNSLRDLFDQLTDDNTMGPEVQENVTVGTKPLTITVKELPEDNKPADYNGAVGSFTITASLTNRNMTAQDDATLQLVVNGKGNLPVINAPQVTWPSGIEAFEPTAKEDVNKTTVPMSGSKTFAYVFTARTPGHYTIPSVNFSFFDPVTHTYKKASTAPLDLQVSPSVKKQGATTGSTTTSPASPQSVNGGAKKFIQDHLEWLFAVLILSGLAVYLWRQNMRLKAAEFLQKQGDVNNQELSNPGRDSQEKIGEDNKDGSKKNKDHNDSDYNRQNDGLEESEKKTEGQMLPGNGKKESDDPIADQSFKHARPMPPILPPRMTTMTVNPLLDAKQLFEQGDYKGFYREVNRAVWKAITQKTDLPASELNKYNIARQLEARGWDRATILSLESILNECEMNLYTPAYDTYNMQQLLRQTESLFEKLV